MTPDRHLPSVPASTSLVRSVAPSLAGHSLTPFNTWRHAREVQRHLQQAVYSFEIELIDLEAASQIALAQLQAELALYVAGMTMAGSDTAMQYLVARKLAAFAESNMMRLLWRTR